MTILKANKACQIQDLFNNALSHAEEAAIRRYKSFDAYPLNEALRSQGYESLPGEWKALADNISSGIQKLPKYNKPVYRNVSIDDIMHYQGDDKALKFIQDHCKGNIVQYDGYTSTSKSTDGYPLDAKHQANITITKNKTGRDLTSLPGVEGENEVLFDRGSKFKVLDSKWSEDYNNLIIKMEEL